MTDAIDWTPPDSPGFWRRLAHIADLSDDAVVRVMLSPHCNLAAIIARLAKLAHEGGWYGSKEKAGYFDREHAEEPIRGEISRMEWSNPDAKLKWALKVLHTYYKVQVRQHRAS